MAGSPLVDLPEVERLSPAVVRILGGNPGKFTLQGTNTYLVGTGRERLLIDTGEGMASWADAVARTLAAEGGATLAAVLVTHWHPDHVGGIGQVRTLAPAAAVHQCLVARRGPPPTATTVVPGLLPPPLAGAELADIEARTLCDLADGQVFAVEGATLRAVHAPGHTTDHMVFVLEEENAVFAGDNVLGQGTAVFEDLAVYLASLARMHTLFADGSPAASARIYPGHGPVVHDGPAKLREYIHHRQQREDQVMQLLRAAGKDAASVAAPAASPLPWTTSELAHRIYADVPANLLPAAQRGLTLILQKLEREGTVSRDGQSWVLQAQP